MQAEDILSVIDRAKQKATEIVKSGGLAMYKATRGLNPVSSVVSGIDTLRKVSDLPINTSNYQGTVGSLASEAFKNTQTGLPQTLREGFVIPKRTPTGWTTENKPTVPSTWVANRVVAPAMNVPESAKQVKTGFQRVLGGDIKGGGVEAGIGALGVVGGLSPGPEDLAFSMYDATKARMAGRDRTKGFTGEEYTGLGTAINAGKDTPVANVLNTAELPMLLLAGGLKAKSAKKIKGIDPTEALKVEARKYKSAEEFVKAQGDTLYHGTPAKFDTKDFKGGYLTADKNYADVYKNPSASSISYGSAGVKNKLSGEPRTLEFVLPKNAKIFDYTNPQHRKLLDDYWGKSSMSYDPVTGKSGQLDWTEGENLVEYFDEKGIKFDGIKLDEAGGIDPISGLEVKRSPSIRIINPKILKDKSQLTDLWEKNAGKTSTNIGRGIQVSQTSNDLLSKHTFAINGEGYPVAKVNGRVVPLHELVMGTEKAKGFDVDHINGNKLDNRVENLRVISHKANSVNTKISKANTSGIKGVQFDKTTGKWVSRITVDNKNVHLGSFPTVDDAVKARKAAESKYFEPLYNQSQLPKSTVDPSTLGVTPPNLKQLNQPKLPDELQLPASVKPKNKAFSNVK